MTVTPGDLAPPRTISVRVPLTITRRGGRKLVIAPDRGDVEGQIIRRHIDNAMVKAIARAFRWRDMLESGEYTTVREIARAEKISESYVGRVLRLTLLAPGIVEAILNGRTAVDQKLDHLLQGFDIEWEQQSKNLGIAI